MNENRILDKISRLFPSSRATVGIGDDAAVIRFDGPRVITSDLLIEDIDFTADVPLELTARKSLAVNLSDIAAMGCVPEVFILDLGIPPRNLDSIDRFLTALAEEARRFDVELIGGDLSSAERLTISITMIGRPVPGRDPLLRSGARAGDALYVSRPLGGSHAGLKLIENGWSADETCGVSSPEGDFGYMQREFAGTAIRRHLLPEPEVELGKRLAGLASSCIDNSDGLSSDVRHLCEASGCGAVIEWERVPLLPDLARVGPSLGIDPEFAALHGGEEFSLLFTSGERESVLSQRFGRPVYDIGRITPGRGIEISRNGTNEPLVERGFDHFED